MVPCLLASASLSLLSVMSKSTDAPNTVLTVAAGSPELIILSALAGQQFYSGKATLLKLQLLPASSTLLRSVPAVLTTYPRDMSCHQFRGCRVFGSRSSAVALRPCRLKGQCLLGTLHFCIVCHPPADTATQVFGNHLLRPHHHGPGRCLCCRGPASGGRQGSGGGRQRSAGTAAWRRGRAGGSAAGPLGGSHQPPFRRRAAAAARRPPAGRGVRRGCAPAADGNPWAAGGGRRHAASSSRRNAGPAAAPHPRSGVRSAWRRQAVGRRSAGVHNRRGAAGCARRRRRRLPDAGSGRRAHPGGLRTVPLPHRAGVRHPGAAVAAAGRAHVGGAAAGEADAACGCRRTGARAAVRALAVGHHQPLRGGRRVGLP